MASVEIKTKKWNSVFQTPAGSEANYIKKNQSGELKVIQLLIMKCYHDMNNIFLFFWNIMWSNILVVKHVAFALNKESKNANPQLHFILLREKCKNWQKILGNVYQF